jgi:tripartite-type tricarboxylate transporter receptor subunit TctC
MRLLGWVALATLVALAAAHAQVYPSRAITMVVPFPAGGSTDAVARIVAERMRVSLGQPVVIENVGGAGGSIGVGRVARRTAIRSTSANGTPTSRTARRSRCRTTW